MFTSNRKQPYKISDLIHVNEIPITTAKLIPLTVDSNILKKMPKRLNYYKKVEEVNLLEGTMEDPKEFAVVCDRMKQFRNLRILNICNADIDINYLDCEHLEQLSVKIRHITPIFQTDYVRSALQDCKRLKKFTYRLGYLSTASMNALTLNPIEQIILINVFVEDKHSFLDFLSKLKFLEHIAMDGDINMAQNYFFSKQHEALKNIKSLEICAAIGLNYENLKYCQTLIEIKINFLELKNTHCILQQLDKLPSLKRVTLCKHKTMSLGKNIPTEIDLLENSKKFIPFCLNMVDRNIEILSDTIETKDYILNCMYGKDIFRLCNNEFAFITNCNTHNTSNIINNIYEEIV